VSADPPRYVELHALTNFSFLRGASSPAEMVGRAAELGYAAVAVTDECSVAGVVRAHAALRELRAAASPGTMGRALPRLIVGAEFRLDCGLPLVVLAADRRGYGQLCRLITRGRRAAPKGRYSLARGDVEAILEPGHCLLLWPPRPRSATREQAEWLRERFDGSAWIAVELLRDGTERAHLATLTALGRASGLPLVAAGGACMHVRERRRLHDALTAIRLNVPVGEAGIELMPNGERHLRERTRLARLYPRELLDETLVVAGRCGFSLDELRYEYPGEIVPEGRSPTSWLRELTETGARRRWGATGMPAAVRQAVEHELALIAELEYEPYFLTVHDIVEFARSRGILCQGRGSAANSAVCYCLGITEVDPSRMSMLFERFISRERNEPPDIDVDFEHERREEVIQYVYARYGRSRAALAATVISYRPRSVLRDLAGALGLDPAQAARLSGAMQWWDRGIDESRIREAGFDPASPRVAQLLSLSRDLLGFPRHLSQHVGGFVISRGPLEELVPIENAAMPDRTVIQWDKDDLDELGLLKVDLLALGMLSAIRRALALVGEIRARRSHSGAPTVTSPAFTMADVPAEDPRVYDMISRADTVGVFQIESRAQMAMLPRLRPRNFYDLVIEVAIVRPGPIQGEMVHPYLRRRNGEEPVTYPSDEVAGVLGRTLGVPIFQEQVMQLAIVAAGFTPGEADQLRRAMAAWKRRGGLGHFGERLVSGMRERGYTEDFAHRIFEQIKGFGEYGFPESHAASFALLVYVSAWLKCHEPAAFACALLNSQPMGFYSPSQIVQDAARHGVELRPVDACCSDVDCTLEPPALRLGLRLVRGLSADGASRLAETRRSRQIRRGPGTLPFDDLQDLAAAAALDRRDLEALAAAGAFRSLSGHRHRAFWAVAGAGPELPLAPLPRGEEGAPLLVAPSEGQDIVADYRSVGLTLGRHPLALLRERLGRDGVRAAAELEAVAAGEAVRVAGIVVTRQRPGSASGVTFVTLEDETGNVNLVVWQRVGEAQRRALLESRLMEARGRLQREGQVTHVVVSRMIDRTALLGRLATRSRDFH
jgi:error-prone DNA polymerase